MRRNRYPCPCPLICLSPPLTGTPICLPCHQLSRSLMWQSCFTVRVDIRVWQKSPSVWPPSAPVSAMGRQARSRGMELCTEQGPGKAARQEPGSQGLQSPRVAVRPFPHMQRTSIPHEGSGCLMGSSGIKFGCFSPLAPELHTPTQLGFGEWTQPWSWIQLHLSDALNLLSGAEGNNC